MATQALGQALKTNMSKQPRLTAGETYMQSVDPTLTELKGAEEQKMKAEKEKAIFAGESESRRQQALAKATEAEATAMREDPARAQYEEKIQEKSRAEFIPSQENAQDMAALFSLMNVIGFAVGSGGKAHAQQAMSAMNGMLEGHQKGRDDLYKQQKNIFETNQKQLDKKIDDLYKFMQENTKLYARDKVAAEQNANAKFAEEGAGFLKSYYEKYGPGPALEYMKQVVKAKEHAADLTDKERTRAQQAEFRRQEKAEAASLKATLAGTKESAAAGGMDVALVQNYGLPPTEVARLNPKTTLPKAVAQMSSAELTQSLADDLKKNENAAGLALSFINSIDKYLPSRYDSADGDLGVLALKTEADKAITGADADTITEARKIAKKAVDVINARALAASGGARVLVSELRLQKDVIGLENMSPKTAPDVFEDLALRDVDKLKDYGFSKETISNAKTRLKKTEPTAPKSTESIVVKGQTYTRPANFSNQQWADYKKAVGAQ